MLAFGFVEGMLFLKKKKSDVMKKLLGENTYWVWIL